MFRRVRVQSNTETFFLCPPPFAKKLIQARIDQCEVPSNSDLNIVAKSSNLLLHLLLDELPRPVATI